MRFDSAKNFQWESSPGSDTDSSTSDGSSWRRRSKKKGSKFASREEQKARPRSFTTITREAQSNSARYKVVFAVSCCKIRAKTAFCQSVSCLWSEKENLSSHLKPNDTIKDIQSFWEELDDQAFLVFEHLECFCVRSQRFTSNLEVSTMQSEDGMRRSQNLSLGFFSPELTAEMRSISKHGRIDWRTFPSGDARKHPKVIPALVLFHYRKGLENLSKQLSGKAQAQVITLQEFIHDFLGEEFAEADELFSRDMCTDYHADKLFPPKEIVISKKPSLSAGLVSLSLRGRPSYIRSLALSCWSYMPLQRLFGRDFYEFDCYFPEGKEWPISDLDFTPISRASEETISCLKKTGQTFWRVRHPTYMEYSGWDPTRTVEFKCERMMIDAFPDVVAIKALEAPAQNVATPVRRIPEQDYAAHGRGRAWEYARPLHYYDSRHIPYRRERVGRERITIRPGRSLSPSSESSSDGEWVTDFKSVAKSKGPSPAEDDSGEKSENFPNYLRLDSKIDDRWDDKIYMLFPTTISGYSFRMKKSYFLHVDHLYDIKWDKQVFQNLVLPDKKKDLIKALVSVHFRKAGSHGKETQEIRNDLIAGKGNSVNILLHGGPGTGKTLTAECVAENVEMPLYNISCGDIGTVSERVEEYLHAIFNLSKRWKFILLMDEADVFLEERTLTDINRNALVSVFLRMLDYFQGILLLTSNRVNSFDLAFKSRVNVALHYEDLDEHARRLIWKNFLDMIEGQDEAARVGEIRSRLDELVKLEMNGRQIRNSLSTARQLAVYREEPFAWAHLEQSVQVGQEFNNYLLGR